MALNADRPVIQMDLDGTFIKEFSSCRKASKQFGGKNMDSRSIYDACSIFNNCGSKDSIKKEKKTRATNIRFGFRWKFKEI